MVARWAPYVALSRDCANVPDLVRAHNHQRSLSKQKHFGAAEYATFATKNLIILFAESSPCI